MKAQERKRYSSTKFAVLTGAEHIASARKNCFLWIIIVAVLFCGSAAYFSYEIIIHRFYLGEPLPQSSTHSDTFSGAGSTKNSLKLYDSRPLLAGLRKRTGEDRSELSCEESQAQLEAVPSIFTEQMFQRGLKNIYDYINLDLLLHYENTMNEREPKTLKLIYNEYQLKLLLVRNSEDFINFLNALNSNKFKFYAAYLKQEKYDLNLKRFENYFALTDELNHWYNYLDRLRRFMSSYEQQKLRKYFDCCTDTTFQNFTEGTQKLLFHFAYPFHITEKKLQEINEIINEWARPVKIELHNCSVVFYNRAILLSDINKKILNLNMSCLKNVYVFASQTIYLDEDLELLGINLAIISPDWVFLKKVQINLNGREGADYTDGSAAANQPGKPGRPGGNAGDFLGVGNLQEKYVLISSRGGKGGNGQNGANGLDGVDKTFPGPPVNKPACMTKLKTYKNPFAQVITHYKIYNQAGCGGSGTDGGVGGVGGAGGIITLVSENSVRVTRGLNGMSGAPGKGGRGGVGGRNGCFYEVLDVDDEVLHPITRVKCSVGDSLPSGEFGKDGRNNQRQIFPMKKENLTVHNCLLQFLRFAGDDLVKYNDAAVISFLKNVNLVNASNETDLQDFINELKLLEVFDRIEFYEIFREKLLKHMQHTSKSQVAQPFLKYLESIVLGKMLVLKKSVNFLFVDIRNYLDVLEKDTKSTNGHFYEVQVISYLNRKIENKEELIKLNLKWVKSRLIALGLGDEGFYRKFTEKHSKMAEALGKRRMFCLLISTVDVILFLMNRHSNDLKNLTLIDSLCPIRVSKKSQNAFVVENASPEKTLAEYENKNRMTVKSSLGNAEIMLCEALENLKNENETVKRHLEKLGDALDILKESAAFSDEGNKLLKALNDELEHFIELYHFRKWKELGNLFSKSLKNLTLNLNSESIRNEELTFLNGRLVDVTIAVQYKLALDATRQSLFPYMELKPHFDHFRKGTNTSHVLAQINSLREMVSQSSNFFCKNQLKAVFDKNSAVDEFYFWPNAEIKNELKNLFSGGEIHLKSNLINRHIFDKNFVQFSSLRLDFECDENESSCKKMLRGVLYNFKIDITHSGYSYYNWKGETYIVVSEKVSLEYSFKMRDDKEPEVYNALYKKCQDGEIKLSPFTTWTVRLLPINVNANFTELLPLADAVNLRLIGTGTYLS